MAHNARAAARRLCTVAAVIMLAITLGSVLAAGRASPGGSRPAGHPGHWPVRIRPASVNPRGAFSRILSQAEASAAARTCARYATAAGWANTAGPASALVVASAICVAESGGQATVYYCNPTGTDGYYPPVNCSGVYDRGLWQIDSQAWASISDPCAFVPRCNADGSYGISQDGQNFTPWATYTSGVYSNYLSDAQTAVGSLRTGTVSAGVPGVCLSRVKYARNAAVVIARCGSGTRRQLWRITGQAVEDGTFCLAVASRSNTAGVHLRRCNGSPYQQWTALGTGQLRNALAGRCLRDPGGSTVVGAALSVGSCTQVSSRDWWLP
ncbi:MAG TPA: ricin-type beta-trefoil lectin domain protein [Streptosporangiaceae bacterium]|nr:ricin-type beta-trefoil lectin domain protein [Streptosporangiaceae bacterium]